MPLLWDGTAQTMDPSRVQRRIETAADRFRAETARSLGLSGGDPAGSFDLGWGSEGCRKVVPAVSPLIQPAAPKSIA